MNTKQKVIASKNIQLSFPLSLTILAYLLLDKFNASGWLWGVVGTIFVIWYIAVIFSWATTEVVDIFEEKSK
jgi:hypothetical protein